MSLYVQEPQALEACRTLFGKDIQLSREFLLYLQKSGATKAYRQKALEFHPDRHYGEPETVLQKKAELFDELVRAHELICTFLNQRDMKKVVGHPERKPASAPPRPQYSAPKHKKSAGTRADTLPPRPLEFGLFLYLRGIISYRELIQALVWQRNQRPSVGQIAQRWGWLNDEEIGCILANRTYQGRFGERAMRMGLLNKLQIGALLRFQYSRQQRIGAFFVEQNKISVDEIELLVDELKTHNDKLRLHR